MSEHSDEHPVAGIVEFEASGKAAVINYSVPLPGSHTGRRVLELDAGVEDTDWLESAEKAGTSPEQMGVKKKIGEDIYEIDEEYAFRYFRKRAHAVGIPEDQLALLEQFILPGEMSWGTSPGTGFFWGTPTGFGNPVSPIPPMMSTPGALGAGAAAGAPMGPGAGGSPAGVSGGRGGSVSYQPRPEGGGPDILPWWIRFKKSLKEGVVRVPEKTWGGTVTATPVAVDVEVKPRLLMVEVYGLSSFLGDYGLGRTVKTFTLLPGESTTISMRTWRATRESTERGSSIIDSHNEKAADRFAISLQKETTDKATHSSTERWYADAEASASWGFGSAKVKGGGSGEYHSGRDQFAKHVNDTAKEHAKEASAAREMTVTSSSERSEETVEETVIERTIKNVNMRRTLNFVFRELNQEYITKTHLKDVRIAFTNGKPDSWREVPLSGLRGLLQEVLKTEQKVDEVAQAILKLVGVVFDHADKPVKVLERFEMAPDGQDWQRGEATMHNGEYPPPIDDMFYRFKRGALAQGGDANPVDGVVMKEDEVVLRTDSVIVEALLGQADALDAYAMEVQKAAAGARTLENERVKTALDTLEQIADSQERAKAFDTIFNVREEKP